MTTPRVPSPHETVVDSEPEISSPLDMKGEKTDEELGNVAGNDASPVEKPTAPAPPAGLTFPEGGLQAYLTVIGAWIALFVAFGMANTFGIYQDYYTRIFMTIKTASDISWIGSVQIFFLFASCLPTGLLFDLGYFKHLVIAGSLLFSFSHFMLSLAKEHQYYQVFLAQGVGMGIAMGLLFLAPLTVVAHYFRQRRALMMGVVMSGSATGGLVFPIMLNQLFHNPSIGFAWGVRAAAFLTSGLLAISCLLMKTRLPNRRQREKMGIKTPKLDYLAILTDPPQFFTTLGAFTIILALFFPVYYLQLFSVDHGINPTLSFYTLAIQNGSSIIGRTLPNFFSPRFGTYNILIGSAICCSALIFAMLGATSPAGVVLVGIFYGFFSGAYISMMTPSFISLAKSMDEIGIRSGMAFFFVSFGALVGTPIDGALLGSNAASYTWHKAIIFSGVVVLAGTCSVLVARGIVAKRKGSQLV